MRIGFDHDGIISHTPLSKIFHFIGRPLGSAYKRVITTVPANRWAIHLIRDLQAAGHEVVIITGRPKAFAQDTKAWGTKHGIGQLSVYFNSKPDFSVKHQIAHKRRSIGRLGVKVYIEDQPKVARGIAQMGGVEVVLHTGRPQETVKDVWDAIADVKKKNPSAFRTYAAREGKTALRDIRVGDIIEVYYPVTGNFFKAKMLTEPADKQGIWYTTILDKNGDRQRAVWNGRYFVLGDVESNPPRQVIISVPHAVGIPTPTGGSGGMKGHDFIAKEMAMKLATRLNVPDSYVIIGDVPRDVLDLNRERSRWKTEFRKKVRELIKRYPGDTLHLDVHSFRVGSKVYAGNDIAIVTTEKRARPHELALRDFLREHGLKSNIYTEMLMDVVPEGRELGVQVSYLIEFNEGATPEQKDYYADLVSAFVQEYLSVWPPRWPSTFTEEGSAREVEPQANPEEADIVHVYDWNAREDFPVRDPILAHFGKRFHPGEDRRKLGYHFVNDRPRKLEAAFLVTKKKGRYAVYLAGNRTDDRYSAAQAEKFRREYDEALEYLKEHFDVHHHKEVYVQDGIYGGVWIIDAIKQANPQGPLRTPTEAEMRHENNRIDEMNDRQLRTRLWRMTIPQKIFAFSIALTNAGKAELAREAIAKLATLGYDSEGSLTARPQRPARRREEYPAEAASWNNLNGGQRTQIFERMHHRPSISEITAWSETDWADLPHSVKERLIVSYGVMWDETGVRPEPQPAPRLGREVVRGNILRWNQLRLNDLVRAVSYPFQFYGVVTHIDEMAHVGGETRSAPLVWAMWEETEEDAVRKWSTATEQQLRPSGETGGEVTHLAGTHEDGSLAEFEIISMNLARSAPEEYVRWSGLSVGDLVEIGARFSPHDDDRFAVVEHLGRLMYEDEPHGENNSVWGLWERTAEAAKRKYLAATERDLRPFIPGLLKHHSDDGPVYKVLERGISRTPDDNIVNLTRLLGTQGVPVKDGDAELYYPVPETVRTPLTILEPNITIGPPVQNLIILSTHPEIGLHVGDGRVISVRVPIGHLTVQRIYDHRIDFQLGGPDESWPIEPVNVLGEPFNVRTVGAVRRNPECVLCSDLQTPKVYYEDPFIIICDDIKHDQSVLAVLKRHTKEPEEWERKWLMRVLNYVAGEAFPTEFEIQQTMNTEPSHWHVHAVGNPHHAQRSVLQIIESVQ